MVGHRRRSDGPWHFRPFTPDDRRPGGHRSWKFRAVGGVLLVEQLAWGLYLVTAACIIKLVRSVLTAWMLMFGMFHAEAIKGEATGGD